MKSRTKLALALYDATPGLSIPRAARALGISAIALYEAVRERYARLKHLCPTCHRRLPRREPGAKRVYFPPRPKKKPPAPIVANPIEEMTAKLALLRKRRETRLATAERRAKLREAFTQTQSYARKRRQEIATALEHSQTLLPEATRQYQLERLARERREAD